MILLSGQSLTAAGVVTAERMSLQLKERDGTASLQVKSTDGIQVKAWMLDDREPEAGIVWRVRSINQAFDTKLPTINLEHIINTLKDRILFGEITPAVITGTPGATTCTARQAVDYILAQQSDWALGQFDYGSVTNAYKFDGDTLMDALETVTGTLEDALWTYDMTAYPFTLNITQHSDSVGSEMRAGRNLRTVSRTIDTSQMYTRFYPIGRDDLHISGEYIEKNTNIYGVVSKSETDQSLKTEAELIAWANERLNLHAQPNVTISAEGLDLSAATGENLDAFIIGRMCRMPLPEFSTTILERITEKNYPDKIGQPKVVKITLANSRADITRIIADAMKRSGRGGRTAAKKDKEDHAWFEDTNDHVSMTAIGIIGVDATGEPNWKRLSDFIADGEGLHAKVETQINGAVDRIASLEISEEEIRSDVAMSQSQIYTTIQQTASGIHTEIVNSVSGLYAYVDQTASYFRQTYISKTNQVWIQDTDPRNGGASPKVGDIWIESTHQGTWDGAEGFDWEHDEDYDWLQVQGAKIWGWQNNKWELISDQQQVVTMTDVEQTSEHIVNRAIKLLVNDDGNLSVYRAELLVEGDRIRSEVNELMSGMGSTIEQTASAIRSEVHAAQSDLYSFILQTASQITIRVGESNMVFTGMEKPEGTAEHPLVDGDLWLESTFQRTWADMEELDAWIDDEQFDWSDLHGSKVHVYDAEAGDFKEVLDEQVLAQDTDIKENAEKIALVARSVKKVDGKVDVFRAELSVKADKIASTMTQRIADVGSSITQTASQIRSEVHAANSQIYSSITQTASQIRSEVVNSLSNVQSAITQQANRISLVVEGTGANARIKPAEIVAAINAQSGQSTVKIAADKIMLDGQAIANSLSAVDLSCQAFEATSAYFSGNVDAIEGYLKTGNFQIMTNGTIKYGSGSSRNAGGIVVDASVSGNTLTLTKLDGTTVTFSRAVSSFVWGGGSGKINVTALPQNQTQAVKVSIDGSRTIGSNGTYTYKVQYENADGDDMDTGASMDVTVNVGGGTVDAIANYDSNGNIITNRTISSALKLIPWAKVGGTWYEGTPVTISPPSYTRYQFGMTRTQDAQGYHYTFRIDTGTTTPFGSGSSYYLYKAN